MQKPQWGRVHKLQQRATIHCHCLLITRYNWWYETSPPQTWSVVILNPYPRRPKPALIGAAGAMVTHAPRIPVTPLRPGKRIGLYFTEVSRCFQTQHMAEYVNIWPFIWVSMRFIWSVLDRVGVFRVVSLRCLCFDSRYPASIPGLRQVLNRSPLSPAW